MRLHQNEHIHKMAWQWSENSDGDIITVLNIGQYHMYHEYYIVFCSTRYAYTI